ncbi:thiolase family protein [Fimbriiglobus ruber]|uniref:3-ketoacyl-CoA thiolase n=1 Tax=Fimbriiglobus ruber TaxID=1908690 RepID=A0A225E0P6_9BACT|nr:thiolase family protein [Fimbriiglobus ruber]OWK47300.1 3-ketoacyl-CoA thiolase [Fimbriiglobus ruber]
MTTSTRLPPVAVIAGARTPFAKAFGPLAKVPADMLGVYSTGAALKAAHLEPTAIDEVVFGNVAGPPESSNVGRVIALRAGVPADRIAHTVNRNCASGMESVVAGWHALAEGRSDRVVVGGTESMSNVPLLWDRRLADWLMKFKRTTGWRKWTLLSKLRPRMLRPVFGLELGLTDPTCGLNMGQTAERLAKEFGITREEQDQFALDSHKKAAAAWKRGFFQGEVVPLTAEQTRGQALQADNGPRPNQTLEALQKLRPLFDPKGGTVTAGNSCPITDGSVAAILERADSVGPDRTPLGYIRDYAIAGCDPARMGLGPVFATNKLLRKTGMDLRDFELIEINEAFAAQVLACQRAFASDDFARKELGRDRAIGEIDPARLNVNGGAIALGHPVGATGTRLIVTLLRALRDRGLRRGLATLCVGGGQGVAVWVETTLN